MKNIKEKGFALILSLVLLLAMSLMGGALILITSEDHKSNNLVDVNLFDHRYHIIGDFDLNTRLASKWKIECIQSPVAYVRVHEQNESLLKRQREIDELKIWYDEMKNNPAFSNKSRVAFCKLPFGNPNIKLCEDIYLYPLQYGRLDCPQSIKVSMKGKHLVINSKALISLRYPNNSLVPF